MLSTTAKNLSNTTFSNIPDGNNIEIPEITDSIANENLQSTVIEILNYQKE